MTPSTAGRRAMNVEPMTLAEAIAYLKPDPANNGTISYRAPEVRQAVEVLEKSLRLTEHLLKIRTRQCTRGSENWCKAAEEALAGKPQSLRLRVDLHRAPPVDIVLSNEEADHAE